MRQKIDCDSFCNVLFDSCPSFYVPFRFLGGLYDAHTCLMRGSASGAMDLGLGCWTSKDPIGFVGGNLNLYGHAENKTVNFLSMRQIKPTCKKAAVCIRVQCFLS
jgi:RHS repeat-associated protein